MDKTKLLLHLVMCWYLPEFAGVSFAQLKQLTRWDSAELSGILSTKWFDQAHDNERTCTIYLPSALAFEYVAGLHYAGRHDPEEAQVQQLMEAVSRKVVYESEPVNKSLCAAPV